MHGKEATPLPIPQDGRTCPECKAKNSMCIWTWTTEPRMGERSPDPWGFTESTVKEKQFGWLNRDFQFECKNPKCKFWENTVTTATIHDIRLLHRDPAQAIRSYHQHLKENIPHRGGPPGNPLPEDSEFPGEPAVEEIMEKFQDLLDDLQNEARNADNGQAHFRARKIRAGKGDPNANHGLVRARERAESFVTNLARKTGL